MMALTLLILISLSVKKDIFEDVSVSFIKWRSLKLSLIVSSMGSYEMPFLLYLAQPSYVIHSLLDHIQRLSYYQNKEKSSGEEC
jgi:hypothetical protein